MSWFDIFQRSGRIPVQNVIDLVRQLGNKLDDSQLKTVLSGNLDTDIPSVQAVNEGLALKMDIDDVNEALALKPDLAGDNEYTGINDFGTGNLILPYGTPLNAVPAGVVMTFTDVPDAYVKNVQSAITITVATQPNTAVENVNAFGTIEVSAILEAGQQFVVGGQTFTAVASLTEPVVAGEVLIGTTAADQATKIVEAITRDTVAAESTATADTTTVTVTAIAAGVAGNAVLFSEAIGTIVMTPSDGSLDGGVDAVVADTITLDTTEFTFVTGTPGVGEIEVGASTTLTAANIASATVETMTAVPSTNTVVFTAAVATPGTSGDGIAVTTDDTRITGSGVTAGGVDEVRSYLTIADINYVFYDTAGDDPLDEYPLDVPVAIDTPAPNLVTALLLDTNTFAEWSVSRINNIVTANYKIWGAIGNTITYVNNLVTAGDITDNSFEGFFVNGMDGTPGASGQVIWDGNDVNISFGTNGTANTSWEPVTLLKQVKVVLTPTDILAIDQTPIELIAAPGEDKLALIHSFVVKYDYSADAYTGTGDLIIFYDNDPTVLAVQAGIDPLSGTIASTLQVGTEGVNLVEQDPLDIVNKSIFVSSVDAFTNTAAEGTVTIILQYSIINLG